MSCWVEHGAAAYRSVARALVPPGRPRLGAPQRLCPQCLRSVRARQAKLALVSHTTAAKGVGHGSRRHATRIWCRRMVAEELPWRLAIPQPLWWAAAKRAASNVKGASLQCPSSCFPPTLVHGPTTPHQRRRGGLQERNKRSSRINLVDGTFCEKGKSVRFP